MNVADSHFFSGKDLGKTIKITDENDADGKEQFTYGSYKIVGIVNSPNYIMKEERGTTSLGDGRITAYVYMPVGHLLRSITRRCCRYAKSRDSCFLILMIRISRLQRILSRLLQKSGGRRGSTRSWQRHRRRSTADRRSWTAEDRSWNSRRPAHMVN